MTNIMQNPITCSGKDQEDRLLHFLQVEAELKRVDGQADHEYVPMDVFVDPRTMKEHFQYSSGH
jgi:hypothetical protein